MKLGVAIPTYDLESGRPLSLREVAEYARRAEALGFHSAWVMDHHWLERDGVRVGAHDPNITLAYVAAVTSSITLGVLVLANGFRPLNQLSRETAALADALPGRFILGLGCGSQPGEHEAFDLPFERRVGRLESTLKVLPQLLGGQHVTYRDDFVHLGDASTLTTEPAPPIWIAGFGPRMMRLTATSASGWITAWHGPDPAGFRSQLEAFQKQLAETGRSSSEVEVCAGFLALPGEGTELEVAVDRADRLLPRTGPAGRPAPARERMLVGAPEEIADALRVYAAAGATHGILNLSPSPFGRLEPSLLEGAARIVDLSTTNSGFA